MAHMTKALFEIAEVSYSAVAETSISDCGDHRQQPNNPTTHPQIQLISYCPGIE